MPTAGGWACHDEVPTESSPTLLSFDNLWSMAALLETFDCERCGKLIPCANRQLHELRCGGVPETPAVDAAAASDGGNYL